MQNDKIKVMILKGSPKPQNTTCHNLIQCTRHFLEPNPKVVLEERSIKRELEDLHFEEVLQSDRILWVTPIYEDSVPSHVLEYMQHLYEYCMKNPWEYSHVKLYVILVGGLPHKRQHMTCYRIMNHLAKRCGFTFCGGIGVGLAQLVRDRKGLLTTLLKKPVVSAIRYLAECIEENRFCSKNGKYYAVNPFVPAFLFLLVGNYYWIIQGKKWNKSYKEMCRMTYKKM